MVNITPPLVNGIFDMVATTCEMVNEDIQINNTDDQLQSDNMIIDVDDEVSVVDNEIIKVATCMVSIMIYPLKSKYLNYIVVNVIV